MKKIKEKCMTRFLALLSLLMTSAAFTAEVQEYRTGAGFTFTHVEEQFWKSPDGLLWSTFQGKLSNLGTLGETITDPGRLTDREVLNSDAALACAKLGAKLPTREQFARLFEQMNAGDFQKLFLVPEENMNRYWTRNGAQDFARFVQVWKLDAYGDMERAKNAESVVCVR